MDNKFLKRDVRHFLVNPGTIFCLLLFYIRFGFYGWPHLLSVIFIHYSVLPLDDWIERARPFPYYVLPMLAFAVYYFPLVTALALAGDLIVNLRAIVHKDNFILERFEALGDVLIYVLPFTLPIGLNNFRLYAAAVLFILFADSFHKIGHRETVNQKLMWWSGLAAFFLVAYLFATPTLTFVLLFAATLLSLAPFELIRNQLYSWRYSQVWFVFASLVGFYYYLYFVV